VNIRAKVRHLEIANQLEKKKTLKNMSPFSRLLNRPYLVLLLCIVSCVACAILVNITHQSRYDQYEKENQFLKTKLGQFEGKMSSLTGDNGASFINFIENECFLIT